MALNCAYTECVILASGGSLTVEDCETVRQSGMFTIAVNNTWEIARFCDVIFAGDFAWWKKNREKITISPHFAACENTSLFNEFPDVEVMRARGSYNSGAKAIEYAIKKGYKKILLLGFDCSLKNGVHWHGAHEGLSNPNGNNVRNWHGQFQRVAKFARRRNVEVVNC